MNKLTKSLDNIDVEDIWKVNRVLKNIHSDIMFFSKLNRKKDIHFIKSVLIKYLSINENQFHQEQDLHNSKHRLCKELRSLIRFCDEVG